MLLNDNVTHMDRHMNPFLIQIQIRSGEKHFFSSFFLESGSFDYYISTFLVVTRIRLTPNPAGTRTKESRRHQTLQELAHT